MLLLAWMIHQVQRRRRTTSAPVGDYGDPSYTAQIPIMARLEKRRATVRRGDGETVTAEYVMATLEECRMSDVFWFPSIAGEAADDTTDLGAARRPVAIEVATTKSGAESLWQVYF